MARAISMAELPMAARTMGERPSADSRARRQGWTYRLLYSFIHNGTTTPGPLCSLTLDAAGNLYGTTFGDGAYGFGSVFKLTPSIGGWIYTDLHDFTGGNGAGTIPSRRCGIRPSRYFYGTTTGGGAYGYGVVWEITP